MRGLLYIGLLAALVAVGYLQLRSGDHALAPTPKADQAVRTRAQEVQQQVNDAMQEHMDKLRQYEQQTR